MNSLLNKRFLALSLLLPLFWGCKEDLPTESTVTRFEPYTAIMSSTTQAVTAQEWDEAVYTFDFTLDNKQITDVIFNVKAGTSSTAKEGVDFDILTPEIELKALAGLKGFSVQVQVYKDFLVEDDETIYLTFSTTVPSGIDSKEFLAVTIVSPAPPNCGDYDYSNIIGVRDGHDVTLDGLGLDPYPSHVEISGTIDALKITGLGVEWMTDFWGEVIIDMKAVNMVAEINPYAGTLNIPTQSYISTTYDGDPQPVYTISGSGVIDICTKTITIQYTLNNGADWGKWTHDNGYMSESTFTAVLTIP
jgi:hypothetical protein